MTDRDDDRIWITDPIPVPDTPDRARIALAELDRRAEKLESWQRDGFRLVRTTATIDYVAAERRYTDVLRHSSEVPPTLATSGSTSPTPPSLDGSF